MRNENACIITNQLLSDELQNLLNDSCYFFRFVCFSESYSVLVMGYL